MATNTLNEKKFESDIEASFLSPAGGYTKGADTYNPKEGLFVNTLIDFVKRTQPKEWKKFEHFNATNTVHKFCNAFNNACESDGLVSVLRHGFKHRGIKFRVCYFKPESTLNQLAQSQYASNTCECYRQWYYSDTSKNSVDMVLVLNGIPVFAFELKNQYTGQTVENAQRQWMYDRDPREVCFRFNNRILAYFCVDHTEVYMTTKLADKDTYFLPFNQGSNSAGNDGGKGNPPNPNGYPTSYLWEYVFQKDSMMDIIQKFINLQSEKVKKTLYDGSTETKTKKTLVFPRYHQLDVVRKLIADVSANGVGRNYLIQHSAGSGKSNSIAWVTYRLASLHRKDNTPVFSSVVVVTDRTVLDAQLQATISSFDHTLGSVETIGEDKTSKDLRDALNGGARIIVTTLQKFPVIYEEVDEAKGRCFAIVVDEAHSSQTGTSALKLKTALADTDAALKEYAELEGKAEEELDKNDKLLKELIAHGKHKNLSFFAFTATPKPQTLEQFGTEQPDGSFHPFHVYSMLQAIEEGFILDVLQNYMTYRTCYKIAKTIADNPEMKSSRAAKVIRKYEELHPENISQKSQIIVETFLETTRNKIGGKGKMMVVTPSRLAAVKYAQFIKEYIKNNGIQGVKALTAFSGSVKDGGVEWTEGTINKRDDGSNISENQTKQEFHDNFNILIVAEKYQTGFDEPLLHTMIVDKKLRGVKAVQTLSRLNRIYPGKTDTFIIDFVNTKQEIKDAFQPFYQETYLADEVNADLINKTLAELHKFAVYNESEIEAFAKEYFKQDCKQGVITSILKPVADRYNQLDEDDRYQFRRQIRSFCRWYNYITQITRMFDEDTHKEYQFCNFLYKLLPPESVKDFDLEGKLKLEYYKLQKTSEKGAVNLDKVKGKYDPAKIKSALGTDPLEPLDEIIKSINEKTKTDFGESDRVMLNALYSRLKNDKKLSELANTSDPQIFKESVFPKIFEETALESYNEHEESYQSLFENKNKFNAFMSALGAALYSEFTTGHVSI